MEENEKNLNTEEVSEPAEEVTFSEDDINVSISSEENDAENIGNDNNIQISAEEIVEAAEEETAPAEEVVVDNDDFSFFLSVLDESSEDYDWVMNQLSNTVPVNDMVEEYDEAMKLRAEAEAAAEKARLEAEEKERARIEEERRLEEARIKAEEEARIKAEEEARLREEEEARRKEEEARQKEEEARQREEAERLRLEEAIKAKAAEEARKARELAEEEARIKAEEEARLQAEAEKAQREQEQAIINDGIEPEFEEDDLEETIDNESSEPTEDGEVRPEQKSVDEENIVFEDNDDLIDEEDFIVGRRRKKMDDRLAKLGESVEDHMQDSERAGKNNDYKARFDSIFGSSAGNKNLKVFGIPKNVFGIIITVIFAVDMLLINSASYKIIYFLMEKLLVSNGVEALRLTESGFSNIFVGVSYVASFFIGGLVILVIAKLAEKIIQGVAFANGRAVTMAVVGVFTLIFLVGAAVVAVTNGNLLSIEVYRWVGPLLTYLGGLLFLAISKVSLSIDY